MMFDRATLEAALSERIDLAIYGGSALALAFDYRRATKVVDAVLMTDPAFVRRAIAQIADEHNWPEDWLNDAVKSFLSEHQELALHRSYPSVSSPGLRVFVPSPRYLLAMKCMTTLFTSDEVHGYAHWWCRRKPGCSRYSTSDCDS